MKKIVHIDLNAFFAQVETLKDPSLRGKAIAVGNAQRRGVVATASYEARKSGVHSGMPMSEALILCPGLLVIPGHFHDYERYSKMFFGYLKKRYPLLEQASIDECYIDMTEAIPDGEEEAYLFDLQLALYKATDLKCSIGEGKNKFLAKMGSDLRKPLGLTILSDENIPALLWPLAIEKMFGIGKKTAPRLRELGILTIGDLAKTGSEEVKALLGSSFEYFQGEANGWGDDTIDTSSFDPKSISAERTFSEDTTSYDELRDMIRSCCEDVAGELSGYEKSAVTVELKLRTPDFVTKSHRITLKKPISSAEDLFFAAMTLFDKVYQGQPLRLLGVGCAKVVERKDGEETEGGDITQNAIIEEINKGLSHGGKVFLGSKLKGKKK
jgi:DNA polymerase-4